MFAVPGDLVSSSFLGTNNLIRNGATPVFSPNDILESYYFRYHNEFKDKERFADDEIIKRAQKYLTNQETQKPEIKEQPKAVTMTENMKKDAPDYLTDNAKKVYDFIGNEPVHIDEIINKCGLTTEKTLSAITELEIYGLVTQLSGRRYKIN